MTQGNNSLLLTTQGFNSTFNDKGQIINCLNNKFLN